MTPEENKVIQLTADVVNAFKELPVMHPADAQEMTFYIHGIQNIIYAREGVRSDPTAFNLLAEPK